MKKRHRVGGKRLAGTYRSRASGQRVYVRNVMDGHVFFTAEPQGWQSNMPLASFERQYARDR